MTFPKYQKQKFWKTLEFKFFNPTPSWRGDGKKIGVAKHDFLSYRNHLTLETPTNNVNQTANKSTLNRLRAGTILPGHHKLSLLKTISITLAIVIVLYAEPYLLSDK